MKRLAQPLLLIAICLWSVLPINAQFATLNGFRYANISTSASTIVAQGPVTLHTITVNNAGSSWTMQIFDNATACSGTTIAGASAVTVVAGVYVYDLQTTSGLCIKTASGTPGDLTVTYR